MAGVAGLPLFNDINECDAKTVKNEPMEIAGNPIHCRTNSDSRKTIAVAIPQLSERDVQRFWVKVDIRGPDDCWPWLGAAGESGHGRFKIAGKLYSPHRISYTLANGDIDNADEFHGTVVRHTCDNPPCCNPAHLTDGRQLDNVKDMDSRGRDNRAKGENAGNVKLTAEIVRIIRESPLSSRKMAEELGEIVRDSTIRQIRRGEVWAHVANDNVAKTDAA
jgi:hypothetical protein